MAVALISLNELSAISAIFMPMKTSMDLDRLLRRSLVVIAVGGLAIGAATRLAGYGSLAHQFWFAATVPVALGLIYSIVRDLAAGRMGVDAIALVSMLTGRQRFLGSGRRGDHRGSARSRRRSGCHRPARAPHRARKHRGWSPTKSEILASRGDEHHQRPFVVNFCFHRPLGLEQSRRK